MIVRILSEGQYRLASSFLDELNALDDEVVKAVATGDQSLFSRLFTAMIELIQKHGIPLAPDQIQESDIIVPPPDLTLEEARGIFKGVGIVPG